MIDQSGFRFNSEPFGHTGTGRDLPQTVSETVTSFLTGLLKQY